MVYTMIVMVYTMVYIHGIYHDIYHLPLLYIPWYIPKVVYSTFGVVYTMRQPSRCLSLKLQPYTLSSLTELKISSSFTAGTRAQAFRRSLSLSFPFLP